ncbi:Crp/Fnr family transcriptional regulator [Thermodesulfobium narugense]|uniref:Crp/Fnr family transcriptional regulator n=1 Tax=Thermodesulfobium narugense TaxID=184064 RepID=UPI000306CB52|nr:Crp/Fnr family transcriptional regulator [Thermodesulfobium narugense]
MDNILLLDKELKEFTEQEWHKLLERAIVMKLPKGSTVFSASEKSQGVFIIKSGWVKISRISKDGKESVVGCIRNPKEIIGLAEVLLNKNRTCNAVAITDIEIGFLKTEDFYNLIKEDFNISLKIMRLLAARMREAEENVHNLSSNYVSKRLASFLYKASFKWGIDDEDGIKIPLNLTHEEIAQVVGTSRQTTTKALNMLQKKGIIKLEKKQIKILDIKKLLSYK